MAAKYIIVKVDDGPVIKTGPAGGGRMTTSYTTVVGDVRKAVRKALPVDAKFGDIVFGAGWTTKAEDEAVASLFEGINERYRIGAEAWQDKQEDLRKLDDEADKIRLAVFGMSKVPLWGGLGDAEREQWRQAAREARKIAEAKA